jgi:hypothetical protein
MHKLYYSNSYSNKLKNKNIHGIQNAEHRHEKQRKNLQSGKSSCVSMLKATH